MYSQDPPFRRMLAGALLCAVLLAGCDGASAEEEQSSPVSVRETVTLANPSAAIEEAYGGLEGVTAQPMTTESFYSLFPDLEGCVESFWGRISDATDGLADMIVVKPAQGETQGKNNRDVVHDALRMYQDQRIREFENYDILDAARIANDAVVFVQGEYMVLLMFPDNELAREIVDKHIPL